MQTQMQSMTVRSLGFNTGVVSQARTKKGNLKSEVQQEFLRSRAVYLKISAKNDRQYLNHLMSEVNISKHQDKSMMFLMKNILKNTALTDKPDKDKTISILLM